ncbi:MAG: hypothetical protein EZS26_002093 [Candidatus Ordinivivax streblomastigis]|uniref:Uncharacterized protein n=1 Tax=Candidatus Ordinivivax streblomastigis TaxID=2540710 RepID=A0A5M8P059_9BACT|nr:MAG: hypothetical protein EZS26_002093 [Candidatus Ordinivivax streblomastigis]
MDTINIMTTQATANYTHAIQLNSNIKITQHKILKTKAQIEMKNKFLSIVRENIHRDGINDLLGWLETTDWYSAPASTVYHLNQEGGLLEHSINVYNRLCRLSVADGFAAYIDEVKENSKY